MISILHIIWNQHKNNFSVYRHRKHVMPAKKLNIEYCFRDKNLGIKTANIIVYKIKRSLTTITFL